MKCMSLTSFLSSFFIPSPTDPTTWDTMPCGASGGCSPPPTHPRWLPGLYWLDQCLPQILPSQDTRVYFSLYSICSRYWPNFSKLAGCTRYADMSQSQASCTHACSRLKSCARQEAKGLWDQTHVCSGSTSSSPGDFCFYIERMSSIQIIKTKAKGKWEIGNKHLLQTLTFERLV